MTTCSMQIFKNREQKTHPMLNSIRKQPPIEQIYTKNPFDILKKGNKLTYCPVMVSLAANP